jgi:hypothetical protein
LKSVDAGCHNQVFPLNGKTEMLQSISLRSILLLLLATLLGSCATTRPVTVWQDEAYVGKLDNILVIAAVEKEGRRRAIEDAYVERFGAASIGATAGYSVIDSAENLSRETVEEAIAGRSIDAVLVTRLAGVEEIKEYQPPSSYEPYRSYHRYYAHAREFSSPGYSVTYKLLTLETNLYDSVTRQLIWSMQSESIESSAPQKVIDDQIDLTVKQLLERGLVASN